ncbi:hypothetical protein [Cupriavidus taiwanensis]|uniref:Uncharacterized protein n=1 Tax=Cupriavidus taiwanensis TaxID=164546 RepID=A0A375JBJ1_9BURK|nr:hypothetical protein [Cupriavidus taiwanensis]SPS02259.1 conserved hypothetical protein [Cupriavidus taiwanensis]
MYNQIIEKFIEAQRTARQAYQDAAQFEREALAATSAPEPFFAVGIRSEYRQEDELEKFCFALAGNIVSRARREFAPVGARLDIDNNAEFDRAGLDIGKALKKRRDPRCRPALGIPQRVLQRRRRCHHRVPASCGTHCPWLRLAPECGSEAHRVRRRAQKERPFRGGVEICPPQGWLLQHAAHGRLPVRPGYLRRKGGYAVLASMLQRIDLHQLEYTSREKMSMPDLDIMLYNDKWEFKFSHELAEPLMLFVGEYGQDAMQERH